MSNCEKCNTDDGCECQPIECQKSTPRGGNCIKHQTPVLYSDRWDSYYCGVSFQWVERECNCSSTECEFTDRPKDATELAMTEYRLSNEFEPIPERAKKLTADEIAAYGKGRGLFGKRRQL